MASSGKLPDNVEARLRRIFPGMTRVLLTSPPDTRYNCVAFAADRSDDWWWPDPYGISYWPPEAPRELSLAAFLAAFAQLGYEPCSDSAVDPRLDKVAIYAIENVPTHTARQLANGSWASKLGESVDIEHALADLVGDVYGQVACLLQRPKADPMVK
jgi:hypothetical protein